MRFVFLNAVVLCGAGLLGCATSGEAGAAGSGGASGSSSGSSGSSSDTTGGAAGSDASSSGDAGGSTGATSGASAGGSAGGGMSASMGDDAMFLKMVAQTNLAEIAMGRLAVERGSTDAVRQYGQRMIDDHTKANDEVMTLARSKGIALPTQPDEQHMAMANKLSSMSGVAFDKEFMAGMHADHAKVVSTFEDKAKNASDADVRAFATKMLPTLQQHLHSAGTLHDKQKNVGQ